MKKHLSFLVLAAFLFGSLSFTETPANGSGIMFFKGSFREALSESAKSGKPVFVDVYATWCGPCKQLKRKTFTDKEAGAYFNKNFICVSVDGESEEGKLVRNFYNIDSYPTLLITNSEGKQLAKTEGYMKPYILINFGRRVVPN